MQPAKKIPITAAEADQRLDRFLRKLLRDVPLGAIFKHLRSGRIRVDGKKSKPELRLAEGMVLELQLPDADMKAATSTVRRRASTHRPADAGADATARRPRVHLRPRIVFRDDDVLVVDKPAGMAVQAAAADDDSLVGWLDHKGYGLRTQTFAPAPAHRLDRGTSGLCAIGLSPRGLRGLTAAFRERDAEKIYLAVVQGVPEPRSGSIEAPLDEVRAGRSDEPKVRVDSGGRPARTDYEVVEVGADTALLRLVLHSGRKHQIRAHLAHLGHPIVGDVRYGGPARRDGRFLLHAAELTISHPVNGKPLALTAPPPPEFALRPREEEQ